MTTGMPVESPVRGNAHAGFGGRAGKTHRPEGRQRAPARPYWHVLEDDFELLLVNAQHVKNVPGRKTDMADAQWLCQLLEHGLLRASFVPIRELRDLTRYRRSLIAERQRETNRLHKVLEDAGIKLACVATDILGVSGRAMLGALIDGSDDPATLAELAKGRMRTKREQLRRALVGRFSDHHRQLVRHVLGHIDTSTRRSARSRRRSRRAWPRTPARPSAWTRSRVSAPGRRRSSSPSSGLT
jgi:transposase